MREDIRRSRAIFLALMNCIILVSWILTASGITSASDLARAEVFDGCHGF